MHVTQGDLDRWFNERHPQAFSMIPERNARIREAAKNFAVEILAVSQPCPEQARALELTRSALHAGLDAIARDI